MSGRHQSGKITRRKSLVISMENPRNSTNNRVCYYNNKLLEPD